jgi:hypothetical protein
MKILQPSPIITVNWKEGGNIYKRGASPSRTLCNYLNEAPPLNNSTLEWRGINSRDKPWMPRGRRVVKDKTGFAPLKLLMVP